MTRDALRQLRDLVEALEASLPDVRAALATDPATYDVREAIERADLPRLVFDLNAELASSWLRR